MERKIWGLKDASVLILFRPYQNGLLIDLTSGKGTSTLVKTCGACLLLLQSSTAAYGDRHPHCDYGIQFIVTCYACGDC